MKVITVENCLLCPYRTHSGQIGNKDKHMCNHAESVGNRLGTDGGLSKLILTKYPKQPKWCPLEER